MEKKLKGKYRFFQLLTVVLFAILVVRLGTLQLLEAQFIRPKLSRTNFVCLPIRAPEGILLTMKVKYWPPIRL